MSTALKSLGPSQVDREVQMLSSNVQCSAFLKYILANLKSCREFELTQSYLSLYLKVGMTKIVYAFLMVVCCSITRLVILLMVFC